MLPELTTPRLLLRPATEADLDALWAIWAEPEVRRFLFDNLPVPRELAAEVLAACLAHAGSGLGLWTIAPRDSGAVAGCVGLLPVGAAAEYDASLAGEVEPLVALAPAAWHQGYATEALESVLARGFGPLGLKRIVAVVDVPNTASGRLVRRLGFDVTGEFGGAHGPLRGYALAVDAFALRSGAAGRTPNRADSVV